MCGISAFLKLQGPIGSTLCHEKHTTSGRHIELDQSLDIIRHRGPDGSGVWISPDGKIGKNVLASSIFP